VTSREWRWSDGARHNHNPKDRDALHVKNRRRRQLLGQTPAAPLEADCGRRRR
jgi:hypothetical protein